MDFFFGLRVGFRQLAFIVLPGLLTAASPAQIPTPTTASSSEIAQALHLYRTGKFDAAETQYKSLLQQNAKSDEAYAGLARTYLRQQKVSQAADVVGRAMKALPDSLVVRTVLGELYFRQGKIEAAEAEFQKAVNGPAKLARAYWGIALAHEAMSLHAKAKQELETAHQLDADDPDILRDWMETRSKTEQIKILEQYLADENDSDAEEREALQRHLSLLKALVARAPMPCGLAKEVSATEANLLQMQDGPQHMRGFGLDVKVNGQSSKLLLDTGAGHFLLGKKLAEKAGVERLAESKVKGVGDDGGSGGYYGYAASIKVGELEFHDCLVRVSEKDTVFDLDGLVGADLFSDYLVKLDFPKSKLRLSQLPKRPDESQTAPTTQKDDSAVVAHDAYVAPEMKAYSRVFRFGYMLLLPTQVINDKTPAGLFMIDTGASESTMSTEMAHGVPGLHGEDRTIQGLGGKVKKVYFVDDTDLLFAHRKENLKMAAFDLSHYSKLIGTELSGILGFQLLKTMVVTLDYRDGLVDVSSR